MTHPKWLTDIKEREKAATPGPWVIEYEQEELWGIYEDRKQKAIVETDGGFYPPRELDATFIAHSRTDIPLLVSKLETAIEALEFYTNPRCCQLDMEYEFIPEEVEFGTTAKEALRTILEEPK